MAGGTVDQQLCRSHLESCRLGDVQLRNRIVMAPLTRICAANFGHILTDLMREYYAQRPTAGLIITEET
jgi:N-ethylmaleimide reductase